VKDSSALFRHEVGYVFGQLQHPAAVKPLMEVLKRDHEHGMVRHEAAEALGSIATDDVFDLLKKLSGKFHVKLMLCSKQRFSFAFD
jgi:deoxyhypusine monooxygenase